MMPHDLGRGIVTKGISRMRHIYWKHRARLTGGLLVWALIGLDAWTDSVRDFAARTNHPLAPAVVLLFVLVVVVLLLVVRKPKEAALDILVGVFAPLLVLLWHIPRSLFLKDQTRSLLLYAYALVSPVMHARTLLLVAAVIMLGASTLVLRVPIYSVIGGAIVAAGALYLALRIARRSLNPDKLIGEHILWVHKALQSNALSELLTDESTAKSDAGKQFQALSLAFAGELLYGWSQQVLKSTKRYSHVFIIVLHLVAAYVVTLIGLAALHLGFHDTWPTFYLIESNADYWHFLAYTFLSVFNTSGSGITAAAILPGLLQVAAILILGTSTIVALFGVVETLRGRYEDRAKELAKVLKKDHERFEKAFKRRFDSSVRDYIEDLRDAPATSTLLLTLINVIEAILYPTPLLNRQARRRRR